LRERERRGGREGRSEEGGRKRERKRDLTLLKCAFS
jgi:hypothetical protein